MSYTNSRLNEIYVTGLRNQHGVENQAIELLEGQVERLENYPELEQRMREHIEESKLQARLLEELLTGLNESASSIKDTVLSLAGNMAAMMHVPAEDEIIKNTLANFAFEHFEIASYKALITLADLRGDDAAGMLLKQSLGEEEAMAQWIDEWISSTTRTFVERAEMGETAGR